MDENNLHKFQFDTTRYIDRESPSWDSINKAIEEYNRLLNENIQRVRISDEYSTIIIKTVFEKVDNRTELSKMMNKIYEEEMEMRKK